MMNKKIAALMMAVSMTGTMAMGALAQDVPAAEPLKADFAKVTDEPGEDKTGTFKIQVNEDGSVVLVDENGKEVKMDKDALKFNPEGGAVDGNITFTPMVTDNGKDAKKADNKGDEKALADFAEETSKSFTAINNDEEGKDKLQKYDVKVNEDGTVVLIDENGNEIKMDQESQPIDPKTGEPMEEGLFSTSISIVDPSKEKTDLGELPEGVEVSQKAGEAK